MEQDDTNTTMHNNLFLEALSNLLTYSKSEHEVCNSLLYAIVLFSQAGGGFIQSNRNASVLDSCCGAFCDRAEQHSAFSILSSSIQSPGSLTREGDMTLYTPQDIVIGLKLPQLCLDYYILNAAVDISQVFLASFGNIEMFSDLCLVDPLTGLQNIHAFERHLTAVIDEPDYKKPYAVMYVDLNGFTDFNKKFGYKYGDEALKCIARSLKNYVGEYGTVYRFRGDEFCVLVKHGTKGNYEEIARKVQGVVHRAEGDVQIAATVGVSTYKGQSVRDMFEESGMHRDTVEKFFERRNRARIGV